MVILRAVEYEPGEGMSVLVVREPLRNGSNFSPTDTMILPSILWFCEMYYCGIHLPSTGIYHRGRWIFPPKKMSWFVDVSPVRSAEVSIFFEPCAFQWSFQWHNWKVARWNIPHFWSKMMLILNDAHLQVLFSNFTPLKSEATCESWRIRNIDTFGMIWWTIWCRHVSWLDSWIGRIGRGTLDVQSFLGNLSCTMVK